MPRRWRIFVLVAVATIAADQLTKLWARTLPVMPAGCTLPDDILAHRCVGQPVEVIPHLWHWRLSFNQGAAFSLLHSTSGARWLFVAIGVVAIGVLASMVHRRRDGGRLQLTSLALIAGGCLGNLIDRVHTGVVTDFILWHYRSHAWPVFNIADVALLVGVALMLVSGWHPHKPHSIGG
jgi:signal peptidase II